MCDPFANVGSGKASDSGIVGIPDYTKGVVLATSTNASFTIPDDGYLLLLMTLGKYHQLHMLINGEEVSNYMAGATDGSMLMLPVAKGDSCKIYGTNFWDGAWKERAIFFPYRKG